MSASADALNLESCAVDSASRRHARFCAVICCGDVEYAAIEVCQGLAIEGRLIHRGGKSLELNDVAQT